MLSNLAKLTAGVALLSGAANADRYLTEMEEIIM